VTLFLISAIASLMLFLFVVGMRPRNMEAIGPQGIFRRLPLMLDNFIERRLHISEPADRWLISVLVAAGVFALLLFLVSLTVLFEEREWPWKSRVLTFTSSQDFGALVFGCFFGIFFGYWLRSIYFRDPKEPTRFSDIITACVFLFVAFLGIIGPNSLVSAFSHLTALKIGGTELTFSDSHARAGGGSTDTSLAAIVPPSPSGGNEAAPPDTSSGLSFLAQLPELIARDAAYYYLRMSRDVSLPNGTLKNAAENQKPGDTIKALSEAHRFAKSSLAPIAKCLQLYVSHNGDDAEASEWLTEVARWLRAIQEIQGRRLTLGDDNLPDRSWRAMWKLTGQLGQKRQRLSPENEICTAFYDDPKHPNILDDDSKPERTQLSDDQQKYYDEFIGHLDNEQTRIRPYLAIAAASGLAYGHDYAAALTLLDRWLRANTKKERLKEIGPDLSEVFEIRVRILIAGYLEEWIRYSPTAKTQTVLRYHRDNLERSIALVDKAISKTGFDRGFAAQTNFQEGEADARCTATPRTSIRSLPLDEEIFKDLTAQNMQLSLQFTLITLKRTWIDTVLETPDAYWRAQSATNRFAKEVKEFNYACLLPLWNGDSKKVDVERAASADIHARVELADALSPARRVTSTREKRTEKLTAALLEVLHGLTLLPEESTPPSPPDRASADSDDENIFMKQISAKEASEYRDRLTSIRDRLLREIANDR
jgi:hypothetical protein